MRRASVSPVRAHLEPVKTTCQDCPRRAIVTLHATASGPSLGQFCRECGRKRLHAMLREESERTEVKK